MILKRIEIYGFKSFGKKTVFDIQKGITAIVGPNGSGKSNIVDAIKWVLGEQSPRELRGSSMQDVIFNGTNDIPSLSMAEVSLIIEDVENKLPIDYTEIRITRRLFRSGESQYLINKKICRLKDIQELFMDTGIGNNSYAIMSQGKIDQMVTAKPEERRVFFEEAAGITKYKTKRNEALRKLNRTQENLTRVNDILRELEKNITSLKIKAGKAQKYEQTFTKLKRLEAVNTIIKTNKIKEEINFYETQREEIEVFIEKIKENIFANEKKLLEIRKELEKSDSTYRELFEKLTSAKRKKEQLIQEKILNEKRSQDFTERKNQYSKEIEILADKLKETQKNIEELESDKNKLEQIVEEKKEILIKKEEELKNIKNSIHQLQNEVNQKSAELFNLSNEESKIKNNLIETNTNLKNFQNQLQRIETEKEQVILTLKEAENLIKTIEKDFQEIDENLKLKRKEREEINQKINSAKSELGQKEQNLIEIKSAISEKKSRLNALEKLESSYEGFYEGTKKIMENKNDASKGIVGTISDIINVEKDYADIVEIALGEKIQNIITHSYSKALEIINELKENKLGTATLVPLDNIADKNNENMPDELQDKLLSKFIKIDEQYKQVLNTIIGNTVLVDSIDEAKDLSQKYFGFNWITKSGEILTSKGWVKGGDFKSAIKGIISRKAEIKAIKKEISLKEKEAFRIQQETIKKKQNIEELSQKLVDSEKELTQIQIKHHETEAKLKEQKIKLQTSQNHIETIEREKGILEKEIQNLIQREEEYKKALETLQNKIESLQKEINNEKQYINETVKKIEAMRDSISNEKIKFAEEKEKLESIIKRINDFSFSKQEIEKEIQIKEKFIQELDYEYNIFSANIASLEKDIMLQDSEESSVSEKIRQIEDKRSFWRKEENEITEKIHQLNASLQDKQEELSSLGIKITELESNKLKIKENYKILYEEEPDIEQINLQDFELPENIENEIDALKKKIKYLGPVNREVIQEYEEAKRRYEFLQNQKKDLEKAKADLTKIINKLNEQAKKQFEENFKKIRKLFKEIFTLLFKGGKADISLVDENDLLESGIEITAKPPGKPNQNINLLSGGEKALASIALLFAIFKLKPSFFCVLDELDAPLDESNILRFLELLKSFTDKTQFLIITHNKTTIKIADQIYGITMAVPGLSTVVSASLKEKPLKTTKKEHSVTPLWENDSDKEESVENKTENKQFAERQINIPPIERQQINLETDKTKN